MESDSDKDEFSLSWDNFQTNMNSELNSLLESEYLVDVTLAVEGRYLKAHKLIMAVCSPYFKELFQVNPCKHPIVFLKDITYNTLKNLLEYMYTGVVKIHNNDLDTFISTAEALKIKGLTADQLTNCEISPKPEVTSPSPVKPGDLEEDVTLVHKSREKTLRRRKRRLGSSSKGIRTEEEFNESQKTENKVSENSHIETQKTVVNYSAKVKNPSNNDNVPAFKMESKEDMNYKASPVDAVGGTSTEVVNAEIPEKNDVIEPMQVFEGPRGDRTAEALTIKGLTGDQQTKCDITADPEEIPSPVNTGDLDEVVTSIHKSRGKTLRRWKRIRTEEDLNESEESVNKIELKEDMNKVSSEDTVAGTSTEVINAEIPDKDEVVERMRVLEGPRGGMRLAIEDYVFTKNCVSKQRVLWKCWHRKQKCKARLYTHKSGEIDLIGTHCHEPNLDLTTNRKVLFQAEIIHSNE